MIPAATRPVSEPASCAGSSTDPVARPLGFNCPACGVVLTITNPVAYDGRPAPCPQCAALVVPPRVVQPGGEELDFIDLHPLPGLSAGAGERLKMPRAVHRPRRRVSPGGDGVGGTLEGVVLSAQE